jgi:hypothetical protein
VNGIRVWVARSGYGIINCMWWNEDERRLVNGVDRKRRRVLGGVVVVSG